MTPAGDVVSRVGQKRIFFGHQSVGENILDGVREIANRAAVPSLRIHDTAAGTPPAGPVLLHAKIGQNGDPLSKVRAFRTAIESGLGDTVDVAAFKFCFWDIRNGTDVSEVFTEYERTLTDLRHRYPRVRFVHVSVPLFARDGDWRASVRRLLGLPVSRTLDNARRHELSELIRSRYGGQEPVFDVAGVQAGAGREGRGIPYLDQHLTDDGGHLNEAGRARLASVFLKTLAEA